MEDIQKDFIINVIGKVRQAQYEALKAVNVHLINLYWEIGRSISEKQSESWGKSIVANLSKELQKEFPGISGFSVGNLWLMAQFYAEYYLVENLVPLVREISWSKHIVILKKCKDNNQRQFYTIATKKFGWTKDVLTHQIENKTYEKYLLNQTNFDETIPEKIKNQAILAVKDHYNFDFLELTDFHSERELELELIKNIRKFLIEMGHHFTFVGSQFLVNVNDKEYKIDLLLYHRSLQCLVAIDLKINDFEPEHKGKMEFYLNVLNDKIKLPNENDSIGIIICKYKDRTVVEYSLKNTLNPIGIATYSTSVILPEKYKEFLPNQQLIEDRLNDFFNLKTED
ncbi:YhcG family protein [Flavobacterium sp.]|jgi:predicted nuclease of restriction endonuclease-like (RecB) superfamily|uniref:YhcG family protein n=1 Tax=Flavobacterium sp. TaxID=239 RepID=UPI0037BF7887